MNYFIAVEVSQEVKQYIESAVVRLWKPALRENMHWYMPEEYHITLKFLGDIPEECQQSIISAVTPVAAQSLPFALTLAAPGAFPTDRTKRVFWMGVRRNTGINDLAENLDRACGQLGFKREDRLYLPHITVARIRRGGGREAECNAPIVDEQTFPSWQISRFVLMQTLSAEQRAKESKARYNIVQTFPLGRNPLTPSNGGTRETSAYPTPPLLGAGGL